MRVEARDIGWGVVAGSTLLLAEALVSAAVKGRFFAYPLCQVGLSVGVASVVVLTLSKKRPDLFAKLADQFWNGKDSLALRYLTLNSRQHLKVPKGDWHREVVPWFRRFHKLCVQGKLVPSAYLGSKQRDRYLCWLFRGRDLKSYDYERGSDRYNLLYNLIKWGRSGRLSELSHLLLCRQRLAVKIYGLNFVIREFDRTLDEVSKWRPALPVESLALFVSSRGPGHWEKLLGIVSYASGDQGRRFLAELGRLLDVHWAEEGSRSLVVMQYAYAIADFDLPLSFERFIEVVNGIDDRTWRVCSAGLRKRMDWVKTYHAKEDLPDQAKQVIAKMWGKDGVPTVADLEGTDCPRLLK